MSFVNVVLQGVLLGGLYALLGCGLSLMFGVMRIVNLAHGDVAVAGAFLAVVAVDEVGLSALGTLVLVVPVMAAAGYTVQRGLLNRALRMGPLAPLLVTLGAAIVLRNVLVQAFSADSQGLQAGGLSTSTIQVGDDITLPVFDLLTLAGAIVGAGGRDRGDWRGRCVPTAHRAGPAGASDRRRPADRRTDRRRPAPHLRDRD